MKEEAKTFNASLAHLPNILSWVRIPLSGLALNNKERMRVELAIEEAIVNVIQHSKARRPFSISLTYKLDPSRQIEFVIRDPGPEFNPLAKSPSHPDPSAPLEARKEGGLGLVFMHNYMDAIFYRRDETHNVLTLVKKITPAPL